MCWRMTDEREAFGMNEDVYGVVQCATCAYWGRMEGVIEWTDRKLIKFICPDCNAIELVKNPDYVG